VTSRAPFPLVGRRAELATLVAALEAAQRGRGSAHLLAGEGGIGKSRLALAAAEAARARGFTQVLGRAYPVESGIPYALFADAFVPVLRTMPESLLQVLARGGVAELTVLFPALRLETGRFRPLEDTETKPRLFDAFAQLLHRLAARQPLLVTLENLQWADPSSIELLHFIARGSAPHPLVLLCTLNDEQRDANPTLRSAEQSLRSIGALHVLQLAPLTREEAAEFVCRQFDVTPAAVEDFVARLHDRTRGNPFFIEETLKALVASGRLREQDGGWTGWSAKLDLPTGIREAIAVRLDRLSADARSVATLAAVVGAQAPHALLDAIAGLSADALLAAVDELRRARILVETEVDRQLAYEFTHPLLQETLYTGLSRARARALHAAIAEALERLFSDGALEHADVLAVHFVRGETAERDPRTVRYLTAAGRSALERGANQEAAEVLAAALAIVERGGERTDELERLLDLLGRARARLGAYADSSALWRRAIGLAAERRDWKRVAALERRLGLAAFWGGRYEEATGHFARGLAAAHDAGDDATTASLRVARSAALVEVGRAAEGYEDAREHGERALAFAKTADDPGAAWQAVWAMAMQAGLTGDAAGTAQHLTAATALAEELRSPLHRLWSAEIGIEYRSGIGKWDEAIALADRTIADARAFGQLTLLPRLLVWSSLVDLGRGDFERATAQIDEAWTLSDAEHAEGGHVNVHAVLPAHVGRAALHLAQRHYPQAIGVGERGLVIADRTGYVAWAMHRLLPIIAEAALWVQDWERAERYGNRMRQDAERLGHPLGLAWSHACLALMRMLKGDKAGAIALLVRAAEELEAIPFVEHAARLRRKLADAYADSGDVEAAVRELRRIQDVFARLDAKPALDDVRDRLRALGARPPARSPGEGVGALTAREVEIARMVAGRKSNKQIAAALQISPRTVGTHLSNIYEKLSVDSRGALTDLVRAGALDAAR
jgi:DNA-binding CsgD family transcriptional regulator